MTQAVKYAPMSAKSAKPRLIFPESSAKVGQPLSSADYRAVSPRIACRELIQNSLDAHAASGKGGGATGEECQVTFKTAKVKASDIPDFDAYREALKQAKQSWPNNPTVKRYLSSIKSCATQDEFDVLHVIDNGKGFDEKGLEAVLAEGSPEKQDGSSGSFGIGHLTTFATSGLQYIFYLGKKSDGSMVAAGHAILSSFADEEGTQRSHHGYYVEGYKQTFFAPYEFCYGNLENKGNIPKFLWQEAKKIEGSGSIVAVIGFKGFEDESNTESDEQQISRAIRKAVAENFAMAICSGELTIQVEEADGSRKSVDKSSILDFLSWMALPDTGTREETKNAKITLEEINTFQNFHATDFLSEPFQDCQIFLRNGVATHNVAVCRNGMLITRRHPGLSKNMFDGKKPLNAVILLSGKRQPKTAHDLVKKAETPLHDRIVEKRLDRKEDKEDLRSLLKAIRDWIFKHAKDSGGVSKALDDEILLNTGYAPIARRTATVKPKPDPVDPPPDHPPNGPKPPGPAKPPKPPRPPVEVALVQGRPESTNGKAWSDRYKFRLKPYSDATKIEMEFLVDTGQDPSCDGVIKAQEAIPKEVFGVPADLKDQYKVINGRIKLPDLQKGIPFEFGVVFTASLPDGVSINCRFVQA